MVKDGKDKKAQVRSVQEEMKIKTKRKTVGINFKNDISDFTSVVGVTYLRGYYF